MSADLNSILMEALAAGPGQGMSAVNPQALLAQLAEENPTVNLLTKYLTQRQVEEDKRETSAGEDEAAELLDYSKELERARMRSTETAGAVRNLREKIEKVYAELESLRERNDSLAVAVGACPLCWGEDVLCPVCAGAGRPGFSMPDKELFTQLVAPAVRRFLKQRSADRPFSMSADPRRPSSAEPSKGE